MSPNIERAHNTNQKIDTERLSIEAIQALMKDLLGLDLPEDFHLTDTGLKVKGSWGIEGMNQLGDGYQATITWILDLISWWFLRESNNDTYKWEPESIEAIVIVDEIEQHLHPKWQRRLLPLLMEKFPKIQFIISTHSPLVASSCENVDVRLFKKGNQRPIDPYGWLVEDVLSEMDVEETRSDGFVKTLARYDELDFKKLKDKATNTELEELKKLNNFITQRLPEGDPAELVLRIRNAAKPTQGKKSK